jgi:UDP-N-acetylglucosamine acyltransferase
MAIHPTAVIEAGAQVDPSCEIGPYAIIGGQVRMGPGNTVGPHAVIIGQTTLGSGNRIFPHAVLGTIPQDLKFRGEASSLVVGDRNVFREFSTANLGTAGGGGVTRIGNGGLFMTSCHVGHDCQIGDGAIITNSVALAGHVLVEDHVHIGGVSAVHQFCRIGRFAFVGGMTGVGMDVAPYCTVSGARAELAGVNVIGMQRAGMAEEEIGRIKQAYKVVFRSNIGLQEAIAELSEELAGYPEIDHFIEFLKGSQRGITR